MKGGVGKGFLRLSRVGCGVVEIPAQRRSINFREHPCYEVRAEGNQPAAKRRRGQENARRFVTGGHDDRAVAPVILKPIRRRVNHKRATLSIRLAALLETHEIRPLRAEPMIIGVDFNLYDAAVPSPRVAHQINDLILAQQGFRGGYLNRRASCQATYDKSEYPNVTQIFQCPWHGAKLVGRRRRSNRPGIS